VSSAADDTRTSRLELRATVLLAVATVATAWSGYQATRWNGEQAKAGARASAQRIESSKADAFANAQSQIDVATFTQWVNAYALKQQELSDFYFRRFRPEFKPAVVAWIATKPLKNASAPLTPFAMPQYHVAARAKAQNLDASAGMWALRAQADIQRSSNYILCVVLFTTALFFASVSTKLQTPRLRKVLLGFGLVVFVGTLVWLATFPVSVSV
jgi:hypothetical protein